MHNTLKDRAEVLLICPDFFMYHRSIIHELESRGLGVKWLNDRVSNSSIYKLLLRCIPNTVSRLSAHSFIRLIQRLDVRYIRNIIVVKGEGMSPSVIRALSESMPDARLHLYLWDGVKNARGSALIAPLFDTVATFDPDDAKRFGWRYRPLFAKDIKYYTCAPEGEVIIDWVFIGTLHSDRWRILKRLLDTNQRLCSFVYVFIPGRLAWWLRHLTNWSIWRPKSIKLSKVSLTQDSIQKIVDGARAVLDIEHPCQKGLTMRSIETLLSHRKLITTNVRIRDSDLYDESRVCVIDRNKPVIPEAFLAGNFRPIEPSIRERYSLKNWVDDILR